MNYCSCPCSDCIFNKLGDCLIGDTFVLTNTLDPFPKQDDECYSKISHDYFANFIIDDYRSSLLTSDNSFLSDLIISVNNYKTKNDLNSTKEEK